VISATFSVIRILLSPGAPLPKDFQGFYRVFDTWMPGMQKGTQKRI
jgi:hypothetical protein